MYSSTQESGTSYSSINPSDYHAEFTDGSSDNVPLIQEVPPEDAKFPKTRHILGFLGFLGFANVYAMRVNLSVAIVAMVNHTAIPTVNFTLSEVCPVPNVTDGTAVTTGGSYMWDEKTQGIVLGSFFYGYVLTQIPGGRLAELYGGKRIYGIGVLITAIFTILTPLAANWSLTALVIVRIIEGMGEGVTFPSMHAMLARWIPPLERSKFAAFVYSGTNFGTVISLPLSGWLCTLTDYGGWELAFYIFGVAGIIWFIFWYFLVFDTPQTHPYISGKELYYIEYSNRRKTDIVELTSKDEVPWKSIFSSVPLWAILVTSCGQSWTFYTILTELPTYMDRMLHARIQQNAVISALPYLTSWICGILCSFTADWILAKGWISQKNSYKIWNTIASVVPSLGLIGVTWAGCDIQWVIIMLAGCGAFQGAIYAGNAMNHIALSSKYAGTMMGFTNASANMCGFLAPYVIGTLINGNETMSEWRLVFFLAAAINIFTNFFYIMFASAEEQPWSNGVTRVSNRAIN